MQTPAPVDYARATSVEHALELLRTHGPESRLVAGGHSLIPMMRLRLARPDVVIDINGLTELTGIRQEGNTLVIGAMARHVDVLESPLLAEHYAIFREAEKVIADPLVRNRGTVGGSMCQADPSEDLSAVAAALKGEVVIRSATGTRTVPVREFHLGPYETVVAQDEILTELRVPIRPGAGSAYEKVERRVGDWPVCSVGAYAVVSGGTIADAGIGLTAVGAPHFTATDAETFLIGKEPTEDVIHQAAHLAAQACDPVSDQRGPADYKRHLAEELTRRALTRSVAASQGV